MNYYDILKISKNASDKEIKNAYKNLVKKYHPDLYVADKEFAEKRIKEINEAYNILANEESRFEYDEYLKEIEKNDEQVVLHNKSNYSDNDFDNVQTKSNFSATNNIFEKFDKLSKKNKIKIFLILLFVILIIFLNNLFKLKNTLEKNKIDYTLNGTTQEKNYNNENNATDNYIINNEFNYVRELENEFNEFYKSLMGEYFNIVW